jgi:hypothetical protein
MGYFGLHIDRDIVAKGIRQLAYRVSLRPDCCLARRTCRSSLGPLAVFEMDEAIAVIDYEMKIAKYIKTKISGDLRFSTVG